MLTIRLQRAGKKNKPDYRIVLAEKTAASQKKFTEVIGSYNPHTKVLQIRNQERLLYWVDEQHVEMSPTVRNLFISKEIIRGTKAKAFTVPKKEVVAEDAPAAETAETPEPQETTAEISEDTAQPAEKLAETVEEKAPEVNAEPQSNDAVEEEASTETSVTPEESTTPKEA